jgi:hypothetical protein
MVFAFLNFWRPMVIPISSLYCDFVRAKIGRRCVCATLWCCFLTNLSQIKRYIFLQLILNYVTRPDACDYKIRLMLACFRTRKIAS